MFNSHLSHYINLYIDVKRKLGFYVFEFAVGARRTYIPQSGIYFPQTKHVETLVQLSHKKPDTNLEVALDFEDEGVEQSLAELETLVKSR